MSAMSKDEVSIPIWSGNWLMAIPICSGNSVVSISSKMEYIVFIFRRLCWFCKISYDYYSQQFWIISTPVVISIFASSQQSAESQKNLDASQLLCPQTKSPLHSLSSSQSPWPSLQGSASLQHSLVSFRNPPSHGPSSTVALSYRKGILKNSIL